MIIQKLNKDFEGVAKKIGLEKVPADFLEISDNQNWRPCLVCKQRDILQVRKALFTCTNCNQDYISVEEDMR